MFPANGGHRGFRGHHGVPTEALNLGDPQLGHHFIASNQRARIVELLVAMDDAGKIDASLWVGQQLVESLGSPRGR